MEETGYAWVFHRLPRPSLSWLRRYCRRPACSSGNSKQGHRGIDRNDMSHSVSKLGALLPCRAGAASTRTTARHPPKRHALKCAQPSALGNSSWKTLHCVPERLSRGLTIHDSLQIRGAAVTRGLLNSQPSYFTNTPQPLFTQHDHLSHPASLHAASPFTHTQRTTPTEVGKQTTIRRAKSRLDVETKPLASLQPSLGLTADSRCCRR